MFATYHALQGMMFCEYFTRNLMSSLAHQSAWELAEILHRDISAGNIMIDVESPENKPRGFLNDWDLCKYAEDLKKPTTQPAGRSVSCHV